MKNFFLGFISFTLLNSLSLYANNADPGKLLVRVRALGVVPQEKSDIKPIGGHASVNNDIIPEVDFSYFLAKTLLLN